MQRTKRTAIVIIAAIMALSILAGVISALDVKAAPPAISVTISPTAVSVNPQLQGISEDVVARTVAVDITINNSYGSDIRITGITPGSGTVLDGSNDSIYAGGQLLPVDIANNANAVFNCVFSVDETAAAKLYSNQKIIISYMAGLAAHTAEFAVNITKTSAAIPTPAPPTPTPSYEPWPTPTPTPLDKAVLVLDSTDPNGRTVSAPSGNNGDPITLLLPLRNRGGWISDIEVRPEITTDLSTFPFEIKSVNYVQRIGFMNKGQKVMLSYNFTLSKNVTKGVKAVKFLCNYVQDGEQLESSFTVFVNVVKGAPETTPLPSGAGLLFRPKVIVSGYMLTPEQVFAGETFDLDLTIENTNDSEDVKNVKVTLMNEAGMIIPAQSGSNTFFIDKIAKSSSIAHKISLQANPDAEPKPYTISVDIEYDGKDGSSITAKEAITIPINQRMRVKIDEPVIMGEVMLEQPAPLSLSVYNLGKSPIYNLMVTCEGEGIRVEEDYFGGNIAAGGSSRADITVYASQPGMIIATVVVTYEDKYNVQTREDFPLEVMVNDMSAMPGFNEGEMPPPGEQPGAPRKFPIVYVIVGAAALAGIAVVMILLKKRKAKMAQEDDV